MFCGVSGVPLCACAAGTHTQRLWDCLAALRGLTCVFLPSWCLLQECYHHSLIVLPQAMEAAFDRVPWHFEEHHKHLAAGQQAIWMELEKGKPPMQADTGVEETKGDEKPSAE